MDSTDVRTLLARLPAHADMFSATEPIVVARAPGRLDLMGGIADYSGSLVLQLPLAVAAVVAAQWSRDEQVQVRPLSVGTSDWVHQASVPVSELLGDYPSVRAQLTADSRKRWLAYVAGAVTVLHRERGVAFPRGLRVLLSSDVPVGKGVSSSAAIEVATMHAICALLDLTLDGRELALLCQKVENLVVGAPCGVMDQMTSACGRANTLLALLCQPAELQSEVALPDGLEVYGIDSGIRHVVSGSDYTSVRVGAFMGYRIIADIEGLSIARDHGRIQIEDPNWHGYLANVLPAEWAARFRDRVPEQMTGKDFLEQYGGFTDTVTSIDPARQYPVRQPTAHPIHEHDRVQRFRELLAEPVTDARLAELGELMYRSHASYSACGLGSSGTDRLVELAREAGSRQGIFGAKITGGGSGGTVAVLARAGSRHAIDAIAAAYERETRRRTLIQTGSSDGAVRSGVWKAAGK